MTWLHNTKMTLRVLSAHSNGYRAPTYLPYLVLFTLQLLFCASECKLKVVIVFFL